MTALIDFANEAEADMMRRHIIDMHSAAWKENHETSRVGKSDLLKLPQKP